MTLSGIRHSDSTHVIPGFQPSHKAQFILSKVGGRGDVYLLQGSRIRSGMTLVRMVELMSFTRALIFFFFASWAFARFGFAGAFFCLFRTWTHVFLLNVTMLLCFCCLYLDASTFFSVHVA